MNSLKIRLNLNTIIRSAIDSSMDISENTITIFYFIFRNTV